MLQKIYRYDEKNGVCFNIFGAIGSVFENILLSLMLSYLVFIKNLWNEVCRAKKFSQAFCFTDRITAI